MKRHRTTEQESTKIKRLYLEGNPISTICTLTGITHGSVFRALVKEKCTRTLSQSLSTAQRDHLFSDLDEENTQYWLGFLAADGGICGNIISLNLAEKDKEHLLKFRDFTKANFLEIPSTGSCRAYFTNKEVAFRLNSYGITSKKSYTIDYKLPLTSHFVRGVFDGDGCVSKSKGKSPSFEICSASTPFILQLHKFFIEQGIELNLKKYANLWRVASSKYVTVEAVFNLLYKGSTIYLERKFNRFGSVLEKPKTKQSANSGKSEPSIPS